MATFGNSSNRISREHLRVTTDQFPGWMVATECMPAIGDQVQCTEGTAQVNRILGKTGDGSRLLELILPDRPRHPFFAAASNVLVSPGEASR